jgi:hypothetical protein
MNREDIRIVRLNRHELRMVGGVALEHHIENMEAGRQDTAWARGLDLTARMRSYWSEYAAAKALGLPWEPKTYENRKDGDLRGAEVRCVPLRDGQVPNLPIRPRDLESDRLRQRPFVLVVADEPRFLVMGWCYGWQGPELGEERAPDPTKPPAWFVSWEKLHPIWTLEGEGNEIAAEIS